MQARLAENAVERGAGIRVKNPSLLAGLLFDSEGQRMTPTHAVKNGKRYRYYVSRSLITGARADAAAGLRLPAAEIEQIVTNRIRRLLSEPASLFEMLKAHVSEPMLQQDLMARASQTRRGVATDVAAAHAGHPCCPGPAGRDISRRGDHPSPAAPARSIAR